MTASLIGGPRTFGGEVDDEGHRTYSIVHLVKVDIGDGPAVAMNCAGLPAVGSTWNFGNDTDSWAFIYPTKKCTIHQEKEGVPPTVMRVEQKASTKPLKRCQDTTIEDPLSEPQEISGTFVKKSVEAAFDRNNRMIVTSSHELIRGPIVEFDDYSAEVTIKQNVANLQLPLVSSLLNRLNNATLWGMTSRHIKFSGFNWSRVLYGTCNYYYKREFTFEVNADGFDRSALDEGTKVLNGHWAVPSSGTGSGSSGGTAGSTWILDPIDGASPDRFNPQHFIRYKDRNGENARVILDGMGQPLANDDAPVSIPIEKYNEGNFLLLGIPTSL